MKDTGTMRVQTHRPRLTSKIDLPGGQDRLRQLILYVSARCDNAERFGRTKLNKILWRADFAAFAERRMPVTGRAYQRLDMGPAPKEMKPLLDEMVRFGQITFRDTDFGDGIVEQRPVARLTPDLSRFSRDDLKYVDESISYYWDKTGRETSDDSHGVAWKSLEDRAPMHYELSYLSDAQITLGEVSTIVDKLRERGISRRRRH